ncbi:transcription elongation factor Spt5 [archaeon]|nr:transcription elongation factor Spt5 [archaeon]|tara:strand:- start:788 stop:1405 length:618 start_codon:yes stop_codon:yes gene_type:complete
MTDEHEKTEELTIDKKGDVLQKEKEELKKATEEKELEEKKVLDEIDDEERTEKKEEPVIIVAARTTTGRENAVIEAMENVVHSEKIPVKSIFHPEQLKGYVFIEGRFSDIEEAIKNVPHVRGLINQDVNMSELERFLISEKSDIKVEINDIVEIIGGPFKGENARITRVDEGKNEITVELLEAAIPIPVTISINSVRIHEKAKKE